MLNIEKIQNVYISNSMLHVALLNGKNFSVSLKRYPRLFDASKVQRANWEICGGGYGIHWPEINEDLNVETLLKESEL